MARFLAVLLALFILASNAFALGPQDVPRITPEELMRKIERGEDMIILDVRSRGAYKAAKWRIKGDVRIAPDELTEKAKTLPFGKEIITYCT